MVTTYYCCCCSCSYYSFYYCCCCYYCYCRCCYCFFLSSVSIIFQDILTQASKKIHLGSHLIEHPPPPKQPPKKKNPSFTYLNKTQHSYMKIHQLSFAVNPHRRLIYRHNYINFQISAFQKPHEFQSSSTFQTTPIMTSNPKSLEQCK